MGGVAIHLDPDVQLRPITVSDLDRMVAEGILGEDDRVELLDGVLVMMSPQSPEHSAVLMALFAQIGVVGLENGFQVATQVPLEVDQPASRPEPDFALVPQPTPGKHAGDAVLVVEVSLSSRRIDLGRKAALYAQAGVPEYWVVDVAAREVVVHTEPVDDRYRLIRRVPEGEVVAVTVLPAVVEVSALLAGVPR